MKRIREALLLLSMLIAVAVQGQYNPNNPPEPGVPPTTYKLTVGSLPATGGSTNVTSGKYQAGVRVNLQANRANNYSFSHWENEQGDTLSTSASFSFIMPEENTKLTARFYYNPGNPADPSTPPTVKYAQVNVKIEPAAAGYLYYGNSGKFKVGESLLYRYNANAGYKFVNWTCNDEVVSTAAQFYHVVREGDNNLVAHYEYDPSSPGEPQTPATYRKLYLKVDPASAAYLNIGSGNKYAVGDNVYLHYTLNDSKYNFLGWIDDTGAVVSTSQWFNYNMPDRDATLTAKFEYNPANPGEPGSTAVNRNVIYGSRQAVKAGETIMYGVMMENADKVTGMTVDITMPEGFEADYNALQLSHRCGVHTLSTQKVNDNTVRIFVRGSEPFEGGNGTIFTFPMKVPAGLAEGTVTSIGLSKGVVFKYDGTQTAVTASDGIVRISESEILIADSPDFVVRNVMVPTVSVMPGDSFDVNWQVYNNGNLDATGGWSETLALVDADGKRSTLATLYNDVDRLGVKESVSRSATVTIPELPGIDGKLDLMVIISPYATSGEIEQLQVNNYTATQGTPITLGKCLKLELPSELNEGRDEQVRVRLSRSGNWTQSETFTLKSSPADSRVKLPATVMIPKGQSGVFFQLKFEDNSELDDNTEVEVTVSGAGYEPKSGKIALVDDEFPAIELSFSPETLNEGESTELTITLPRPADADLVVTLSCEKPARFVMPARVTIPKGQTKGVATIKAVDNETIENTADILFTATALHYEAGEAYLELYDNDMPLLNLELTPAEISEGAGPLAIRGKLTRSTNVDRRVSIIFSDDKSGNLIYDSKVTLEKGVEEMDFRIGVVDNAKVDGDRDVTLTASVFMQTCGCSATMASGGAVSKKIHIIDNDGPSLKLKLNAATLRRDMRETKMYVECNTTLDNALTITFDADPKGLIVLPASATIAKGETGVWVDVKAAEGVFTGKEYTISVSAMAEGYAKGTGLLLISDQLLPDATVSLKSSKGKELMPAESVTLTATVKNEGNAAMPDAAMIDIYSTASNEKLTSARTTKTLQPGESEDVAIELPVMKVPGKYTLTAHVNDVNSFKELTRTNNTSNGVEIEVVSPFVPTAKASRATMMPGEKVEISGTVGNWREPVEVYYVSKGVRRSVETEPDASGAYKVEIDPQYSGDYVAGVCIPGERLTTSMAQFAVSGVELQKGGYTTCNLSTTEEKELSVTITNPSSIALEGLSIDTSNVPAGYELTLDYPKSLAANATGEIKIKVKGVTPTVGTNWEEFPLTVSTSEGLTASRTIYLYCRAAQANLKASISNINTTMTMGENRVYRFILSNTGLAETGDIRLALPSFMRNGTSMVLPSLASGEMTNVDIVLTPTSDMQLNVPQEGSIAINCENAKGLVIPFSVEPVSERTGVLKVDVKDEYTFYTAEAPHVAGAAVIVSHPVTGKLIAKGTTDENGLFSVTLPEGFYTLDVAAQKHSASHQTIVLSPGRENYTPVFLSFEAITYSWDVQETTVDDTYDIVTTVEYETRVPKPVILVEYPIVPWKNGIVYFTVTNKGLITAKNVEVELPAADSEIRFDIIGDNVIPELHAGEMVQIPMRVRVKEEGKYPDLKFALSSYSYTGSIGDEGSDKVPAKSPRKGPYDNLDEIDAELFPDEADDPYAGQPCKLVDISWLVDEYVCDEHTGEPIFTGKKVVTHGNVWRGDCPRIGLRGDLGTPSGGGDGGPGRPTGNPTGEGDYYWSHRLLTILIYGCLSDCEREIVNFLKGVKDAVVTCSGLGDAEDAVDDMIGIGKGETKTGFVKSAPIKAESFDMDAGLDCVESLIDSECYTMSIGEDEVNIRNSLGCAVTTAGCVPIPQVQCGAAIAGAALTAWDMYDKCSALKREREEAKRQQQEGGVSGSTKAKAEDSDSEETSDALEILDAKDHRKRVVMTYSNYMLLTREKVAEVAGYGPWTGASSQDLKAMLNYVYTHSNENEYINAQDLIAGKPESISTEAFNNFIDRYNNTLKHDQTGEEFENMINYQNLIEIEHKLADIRTEVSEMGYANFKEFGADAIEFIKHYKEVGKAPAEGVCASISMQFNQTMVLTRQAFRGTLKITNGNQEGAMEDVKLQVKIRDEEGNLVGSREFAVMAESLNGFEGNLDLEDGWKLEAGGTGEATILFIPSKYAAPIEPKVYSFGGVLSYKDPFTDTELSRELTPMDMTVSPSPLLSLNYFMQRDVMGDDPLTAERIESSVPAEFALIINNKGYGAAHNLTMTTEQPKIIDNSRGLMIDFEIMGSSLNGNDRVLTLGKSIPVDFGTLDPFTTTYAQWWMRSSLMGHFTSYDVKATQVSAYGSEDMSLLEEVDIHELIHGMTPDGSPKGRAFLVNDIEDALCTPDMIWMSDTGNAEQVRSAAAASLSDLDDNNKALLTVAADESGWVYGNVDATWQGARQVESVRRVADGKELPADNVWTTFVTLRNSSDPLYEDKLHFAFKLDKAGAFEYEIVLAPKPEPELKAIAFTGLPDEGEIKHSQVEFVDVTFNKAIDPTTFGAEDIRLMCQGEKVMSDLISVAPSESGIANTYTLDLRKATKESGYYILTVDPADITDIEGYNGSEATQATWKQLADGKVLVRAKALPAEGGIATPDNSNVDYGTVVKMKAVANEGYDFIKWMKGDEIISEKPNFDYTVTDDADLTAQFKLRNYNVTVDCDPEHGVIVGSGSGIYAHGSSLQLEAVAANGYVFSHWENEDQEVIGTEPILKPTVKADSEYYARFKVIPSQVESIIIDNGVRKVHPVPVRSRLYIDGEFERLDHVSIVSMSGGRVVYLTGYSVGTPINVSHLTAGVYLVHIQTEKGNSVHRIVKL